jgi:hypothetical protein
VKLEISAQLRAGLCLASIGCIVGSSLDVDRNVAAEPAPPPARTSLAVAAPTPQPDIATMIRRDPFASLIQPRTHAPSRLRTRPSLALAPEKGAPPGTGIVPNIGEDTPTQTIYVRATIVSHDRRSPSLALIQRGTSVDVVRVGDTLGGARLSAIDEDGITLSDGTKIAIVAQPPATPTPTPAPPAAPSPNPSPTNAPRTPAPAPTPQHDTNPPPPPMPTPQATPENGIPTYVPYPMGPINPRLLYPWLYPPIPPPNGPGGTIVPTPAPT